MEMQHAVTCACGHDQVVSLVSLSLQVREDILAVLRRSLCPACQRIARYEAALACTQRAGLLPLQAPSPEQTALAEIVRASLWGLLCPCRADGPCSQALAILFNRHVHASFWLALRGWPLYRLTADLVEDVFLALLQPQQLSASGERVGESL
jgi:hypothetical protein